jgi:hypothetical protein
MNYDLDHPMWGLDDDKKKQIFRTGMQLGALLATGIAHEDFKRSMKKFMSPSDNEV